MPKPFFDLHQFTIDTIRFVEVNVTPMTVECRDFYLSTLCIILVCFIAGRVCERDVERRSGVPVRRTPN